MLGFLRQSLIQCVLTPLNLSPAKSTEIATGMKISSTQETVQWSFKIDSNERMTERLLLNWIDFTASNLNAKECNYEIVLKVFLGVVCVGSMYRGPRCALWTRQAVAIQAMSQGGDTPRCTRSSVWRSTGSRCGNGGGRLLRPLSCRLRRVSVDRVDTLQCYLWSW